MKKIALVTILASLIIPSFAQEEKSEDAEVEKEFKFENEGEDLLILELTWNNWMDEDEVLEFKDIDTEWYSRGFNFYLMYDIPLGESSFSFAPGLGLTNFNYFMNARLDDNRLLQNINGVDTLEFTRLPDDSYRQSKLSITYLDIPIEFRYRSKPDENDNSFKIAIGAKGGYLIDSHTKFKFEDATGDVVKDKQKNIDHLLTYHYGVTFRVGYGNFNLVGFYSLSDLIEEGKGPMLTPYSIGISLNAL